MAWPDDRDLPIDVDAAFGADVQADPGAWSWTSLTSRLRAEPIRLRAGSSGGAAQVSPGTCTVTLDNDDSALTPLHPISPYWPNVELGTPLRVRLRRVEDAFARTTVGNSWGATADGEAWSVGGTGASVSGGVARHSHSDVGNVRVTTLPVSLTDSEQVADIATSALLTGAALVTGFVFRYAGGAAFYWLRCEFNPGGTTVMLKITRYTTAGGYVDLATLNPVPSLAYAANSYMRVRASVVGTRMAIKVWPASGTEPSGWHLTATDSVVTAPGKVGFQSWLVAGNSNALPVAAQHKSYTVHVDRFSGHADQWEPTYLPTGVVGEMSSAVRVTASGILRRLSQGTLPTRSAMRRTLTASGTLAYWPIEDGANAGQVASALAGHPPLSITGTVPEFRNIESWTEARGYEINYGTSALADVSAGSILSAATPTTVSAATATGWTVALAADVTTAAALSGNLVLLQADTPGGTYVRWQMVITVTARTQIIAYNAAGAATTVVDDPSVFTTMVPHNMAVWQDGANIRAGFRWSSVGGYEAVGVVAGTLGGITRVTVNATGVTSSEDVLVGHLAVWAGHDLEVVNFRDGPMLLALFGYTWTGIGTAASAPTGERGTVRLARLTAEDGTTLDMPSVGIADDVMMGLQEPGTLLDLMRECEGADLGILYERGFALAYLPRVYRYNKPVDLTVNLSTYCVTQGGQASVLSPVYDDQDIRNELEVTRSGGSSAVVSDPESQRRGVYGDSVELNLATDAQLPDQASWRVHLHSEPDLREATFPIDLAANPGLLDGWLSCQVGSRIVRTNPPAQHRPGSLDRIVLGWTETIGPRSWQVQVVPDQARPWDVGVYDGVSRYDTTGSMLTLPFAAGTDTLMSVTGPLWSAASLPLDIDCGGVRLTVTAISGLGPQGFTVVQAPVNGVAKTIPAGTAVRLWQPAVYAL